MLDKNEPCSECGASGTVLDHDGYCEQGKSALRAAYSRVQEQLAAVTVPLHSSPNRLASVVECVLRDNEITYDAETSLLTVNGLREESADADAYQALACALVTIVAEARSAS